MAITLSPHPYAMLPKYVPPLPATEELDYADLAILDLSKLSTEAGKAELVIQARNAMRQRGFMFVINHGFAAEQTEHTFDIANLTFAGITDDEKVKYAASQDDGSFQGYKAPQHLHIDAGVRDRFEFYSLNRDVSQRQHPEITRPFLPDLTAFAKHSHFNVVHPVLRLLALGMDLPEDAFVKLHEFDGISETYMRFLKYYPRSAEEETKTKNVWMKGHTDMGTLSVLYSQPVAALQIMSADGKWQWIRHIPNGIIINAGDALELLSGGFYKATIHRVVQPPPSQRGYARLGIFYFSQPDSDTQLFPLCSEEIQAQVTNKRIALVDPTQAPTMDEYRRLRTAAYGRSVKKMSKDGRVEEEVIGGVMLKHYN